MVCWVKNWLDLSDEFDTTGESRDANVLVTNCTKDSQELSENKRIIITTPGCLSQIHKLCHAYKEEFSQNENGKWQGGFAQIAALGPPFGHSFDILVIDEVQPCKNPATATAHLHHVLACHSTHRILLSGTIVCNKPEDLSGMAYAGNCSKAHPSTVSRYDFQKISTFEHKEKLHPTINMQAIKEFQRLWQAEDGEMAS